MTTRERGHPSTERQTPPAPRPTRGLRGLVADAIVFLVVGALALLALSVGGAWSAARTWTFTESIATAADIGFVTPMTESGEWVLDGHPSASGGRAMVNRAGAEGAPPSLALAKAPRARDVRAETRCLQLGEPTAGGCGLVLRYRDPDNHYFVALDLAVGTVSLHRIRGGEPKTLATAPVALDAAQWHDLVAEVRAESFRVTVDGTLALRAHDDGLRDAGLVGLWAPSIASVAFDELEVEPRAATPFDFEVMPVLFGGKR